MINHMINRQRAFYAVLVKPDVDISIYLVNLSSKISSLIF